MSDEKTSDEPVPVWSEMGTRAKARYLFKNITVEPMLACYIIPSVLASLATQNLNLEKACRVNLGYSDEVCTALERRETANYTVEEVQVQQLVAGMSIWKTLLQSSVPALLIMFLGSWSDRRRRRKPCMLLPIVGEFLTSIGLLLCTYFFYQLPMEFAGVAEALFPALTGGWMTMFMAIFSYIGDVTTLETRTLRIGVVNVFCSVGIPVGTALSGVLYKQIGYYGVFSLAASIYVFSFVYGYLRIKEEPRPSVQYVFPESAQQKDKWVITEKPVAECKDAPPKQGCEGAGNGSGTVVGFLRDFFDLQHIRDTMDVAFKEGSNNRRKRVVLLMIVVMVVIGPLHGEMTVMYLFTRYRFNWNEVDYSIFSTYSMVTNLIGTLVSVGVFSHMLKIDDALIGVMSCMSKILAGFVYAYAETNWQIYLAPLVDIVNGTSFIAMRSIASKLVPPEELGKINSLFGVCEALMPLVYGPMYSAVYAATMDTMPGAFFLLGGALTMPAVLIFAWMYTEHRRDKALLEQAMLSQLGSKAKPLSKKEEALRHFRCDAIATTPSSLDNFVSCPEYSETVAADNTSVTPSTGTAAAVDASVAPSAETVAAVNASVAPSAETVAAVNASVAPSAETVAAVNASVAPSAGTVAAVNASVAPSAGTVAAVNASVAPSTETVAASSSSTCSVPETERGVDNPAFQPDEEVSGKI